MINRVAILGLLLSGFVASTHAEDLPGHAHAYRVTWDTPGRGYKDSMPIGNGDIGLNFWTEQNGDLVFLISKTDAWTENGQLVKLGRVRVSLSPNPFAKAAHFTQELRPDIGEIQISADSSSTARVWVDANHPAIHLEISGDVPMTLSAKVESWRTKPREIGQGGPELSGRGSIRELNGIPGGKLIIDADTTLPATNHRIAWCHHNARSIYPLVFENQHLETLLTKYPDPLLNRTFGVAMEGLGLVSADDRTLQSAEAAKNIRLDLFALTTQANSIEAWQANLGKLISAVKQIDLESARQAHQNWWKEFWERSWIDVAGETSAANVTAGYAMQRWMNACGGRGAMPMKYNGSIFTIGQEPASGNPEPKEGANNPDFRAWGGNYWFQNNRHLYWPMIASGDADLLAPFFKMYRDALPLATDRTQHYFHHAGAAFPETIYFFGLPNNNDFGWGNPDVIMKNTWIRHYVSGGLELTLMMLDAFDHSGDAAFARETLLPVAVGVTTYYDHHWPRGADGKIHMDPAQSLETQQQAVNPAPDIAGLMCVLPRLIALPTELTKADDRTMWQKMLSDLPPLPRGRADESGKQPEVESKQSAGGKEILLTAEKFSKPSNVENPELYAIFPYRIFGVDLPELQLARQTFDAKRFKSSTCWGQDGIQAAMLGLTDRARAEVIANFTAYGQERFKWFWKPGHDWEPDMDNGGAGQMILQSMLLQLRGKKILLLPAWPREWDVSFKLHAPHDTTIECTYEKGRVTRLQVVPESRSADVVMPPTN